MAGSYRHVTNPDGSFRGLDLIENLGDAHEAIEEMHDMIRWLADRADFFDSPRHAIHAAWRYGHPRPPENTANEKLCGFDAFWEADDD
jgi:hypothetical protein